MRIFRWLDCFLSSSSATVITALGGYRRFHQQQERVCFPWVRYQQQLSKRSSESMRVGGLFANDLLNRVWQRTTKME